MGKRNQKNKNEGNTQIKTRNQSKCNVNNRNDNKKEEKLKTRKKEEKNQILIHLILLIERIKKKLQEGEAKIVRKKL